MCFETVLDAHAAAASCASSQDIIDTLLQANDVLSDLIGMSRSGEAIPPDYGCGMPRCARTDSAGQFVTATNGADDGSAAVADFDGLDFVPVRVRSSSMPRTSSRPNSEYRIVFRPKPELLKKANEPLYILRELRRLGTLDL